MPNHQEEFTEEQAAWQLQKLGFTVVPVAELTWRCCHTDLPMASVAVRRQHTFNCSAMLHHLHAGWPEGQFAEYNPKLGFIVDEVIHELAHSTYWAIVFEEESNRG